jgi:apolipoprotein D and lipocalin family protein
MKYLVLAALGLALGACATSNPPSTASRVDLKRYSGEWHEIARFPTWFQRKCARGVTATYTPQPDGTIKVDNQCVAENGETKRVVGTARVVPGSGNSKLKVSFFWPFEGDYWILALDEKAYDWALVGSPSRKNLWVLARDPAIPGVLYERIVAEAVARGYDATKLEKTAP